MSSTLQLYVRYTVALYNPGTGTDLGIIGAVTNLFEEGRIADESRPALIEKLQWLSDHLPQPSVLFCPVSKCFGTCWFISTSLKHIEIMNEIAVIAQMHGLKVKVQTVPRAAFQQILYEDPSQVFALNVTPT